jgi:hypothetical protein
MGVILAGIALGGSSAPARKLYPVDEGPRDRSFLVFRNRLIDAVRNHDLRFIHHILDPQVVSTFGDAGEPVATFKQIYEGKHAEADLWKELSAILSLGGQFDGDHVFCAPYVYSRFPTDSDLVIDYEAVIGKNVRVRARPNEAAPVVERLTYDIVKVDRKGSVPPNSPHPAWVKITTPGGRTGYVAHPSIRGPLDYRACFKKRHGRWRLTALVAGD